MLFFFFADSSEYDNNNYTLSSSIAMTDESQKKLFYCNSRKNKQSTYWKPAIIGQEPSVFCRMHIWWWWRWRWQATAMIGAFSLRIVHYYDRLIFITFTLSLFRCSKFEIRILELVCHFVDVIYTIPFTFNIIEWGRERTTPK